MEWLQPIYKRLAASELGKGHTSGIVPSKNTAGYFGTPLKEETHLIQEILVDFSHEEKSEVFLVNVTFFKSETHEHVHLTGNLFKAYKRAGAVEGDILVFWKSKHDPALFKAELIKQGTKRWEDAGLSSLKGAGGLLDISPWDDEENIYNPEYESPSVVEEAVTAGFFPTVLRQGRKKQGERFITVRNKTKGDFVLKQQDYKCQVDSSHQTFKTKAGVPYMEKHHLISMRHYESYTNDLDDISNIVSLCPNCHRKIHLGTDQEVSQMLAILLDQQQQKLAAAGFEIDLLTLRRSYGIE